jgi:hypothetical protein
MSKDSIYRNYFPDETEFRVVGAVGITIYSIIGLLAIYLLSFRVKNKTSRKFFALIIGMCCCELPRYYNIAVYRDYASTLTYGIHLMAASFFFAAFSIVCYQWSGLLELGSYSRAIYSKPALLAINIIFCANDIINSAFCILSNDLLAYFVSTSYAIYVMVEAVRNLIFSTFLSYYGLRLIRRFWHFSNIDARSKLSVTGKKGCCLWFYGLLVRSEASSVFTTAVVRLTVVLCIATFCFLLRVVMLILKLVAYHDDSFSVTSTFFPLFGLLWFTLCDFIPRALPTISFMILMQSNKAKATADRESVSTTHIRPSNSYIDSRKSTSSWGLFMSSLGFSSMRGTYTSVDHSRQFRDQGDSLERYSVAVNDEEDAQASDMEDSLALWEDDSKPRESSSVWRAIIGDRTYRIDSSSDAPSSSSSARHQHNNLPNSELSYSMSRYSEISENSMLPYTSFFGRSKEHEYPKGLISENLLGDTEKH